MARNDSFNRRVLDAIVSGKPISVPKKVKPITPLESQIQQQCIRWFQYQYRKLWDDGVLFHIPNEGLRHAATGKRMKSEGIVRGVADLCLAMGRRGYHHLYIEMKRPGNYQSPFQKAWEQGISKHGNAYVVCKSVEEFKETVNWYLGE